MIEIKIPSQIKIAGHDYTVELVKDMSLQAEGSFGSHSTLLREIKIDARLNPQEMSCGFIHEFCHAISAVFRHSHLSEEDISAMSSGIHQVLEQLEIRFVK